MIIKMNKFYFSALFVAVMAVSACKKDKPVDPVDEVEQEVLEGSITTNKVLSADKTYLLRGYVRVTGGGKLEIPAGTIIKGEKSTKAALIIEKDGQIFANGTANNPVVFTSDKAAGERNIGDWSGVIIAGKSTVNTADGTAQYEGGTLGVGVAAYGGNEPAHNSGVFKYVRIEFAGIAIEKDKEINGLTLCGVGSGTEIHHVQVSYGGDDAFEFFGGTVNPHHLIAVGTVDDDFDFDQGYAGSIQYGVSIKDPNTADAAGTSRNIELENKGSVTGNLYTRPVISNFTFIGPGTDALTQHGAGIHYGQNSRMILANSIIVNAKQVAVEFNTDFPAAELLAGRSGFSNNLVFGNGGDYALKTVTSFADVAALRTFVGATGAVTLADVNGAGINNISITAPDLTLKTTSVANGKAKYEGADLSAAIFTKETFAGAMGTTDWTKGWASWTAKTNVY
jgi:hypothetical protein